MDFFKRTIALLGILVAWTPRSEACDVVKIEATIGTRAYVASAMPMDVRGERFLVSVDHFLSESLPSEVAVSLNGKSQGVARVFKRDWASDLMLLSAPTGAKPAWLNLRGCSLRSVKSGEEVWMVGYPAASKTLASRDGQLIDLQAGEVRLAAPRNLIQVLGVPERGMSGGALMGRDGSVSGMLIQEWSRPTAEFKGGAIALAAPDLDLAIQELLEGNPRKVESDLPFSIDRDRGEISALGFVFRTIQIAPSQLLGRVGGGHPDGIGGELNLGLVEVVGLSGGTVPESLQGMARILTRVKSDETMRMLLVGVRDLFELGRVLLTSGGQPRLEYVLKSSSDPQRRNAENRMEPLLELLVTDSFRLAEINPNLLKLAGFLQRFHSDWLASGGMQSLDPLFGEVEAASPELDRVLDLRPEAWNLVIEFRTRMQRIAKLTRR